MGARKKLLLLKGAGSSVDYGIPGTKEISNFLESKSAEWAEAKGQPNYYMEAFRAASYSKAGPLFDPVEASFEDGLGLFPRMMSWKTQARDPFFWLMNDPSLNFSANCDDYDDFMPRISIRDQYIHLILQLGNFLKERCAILSQEILCDFIEFVETIERRFDISIFDLNYDNICDIALPTYSTGFKQGDFSPHSVHGHPYGKELYHIHGSIHFELDTDADGLDGVVVRKSDPKAVRNFSLYHEFEDERFDSSIVPQSSLVAGGQKSDQILREPFSSYFSVFTRRIYECDAILFCGYGFNDPHINRVIENRMRMIERPPPCFVIDYCPNEPFMGDRSGRWARNLCKTLHVSNAQFIKSMYRTPNDKYTLREFLRQKLTESTGQGGTSIWRYGFRAALERSQLISDFLYDSRDFRLSHRDWRIQRK